MDLNNGIGIQWKLCVLVAMLLGSRASIQATDAIVPTDWISATDEKQVSRSDDWQVDRFRFAETSHLVTNKPGATLEFQFQGTGLAMRLANHAVPAYGKPSLGEIQVTVDDQPPVIVVSQSSCLERVLARDLPPGLHRVRMIHQPSINGTGCRIEAFRALPATTGDIQFQVQGEENAFLVDVRAIVTRGGVVIRDTLVRNWLNGHAALVGLPAGDGYQLEIRASGWRSVQTKPFQVQDGKTTSLEPIFLVRQEETRISSFRFPALNQPAIRKPGTSFRARFLGFDTEIKRVTLSRRQGSATISRQVTFQEDRLAAFYYDREVVVQLPADMPDGLYDLSVYVEGGRRTRKCHSPRSVFVVQEFPRHPVFVSFGHLDTSAQCQAEYLQRLANVINILSPDMVLISNAVNPAYISGALARLEVPYVINFGNHQFHGNEKWYGSPVGIIDYGPGLSILNFGYPWHVNLDQADALLSARGKVACKVINAFEHNAPVKSFLDKHQVNLIHDAHGIGAKVMNMGTTPTRRVGKVNSESFRIIRFQENQVVSCTYLDHETAPIPFAREAPQPLERVAVDTPDPGTLKTVKVINRLEESYRGCRLRLVMPRGNYRVVGGHLLSAIAADDGQQVVLTVTLDLPARQTRRVSVQAR
ncbi:MAG: hypothetical protein ABGX05_07165 [Pirellulaceae bacterium]